MTKGDIQLRLHEVNTAIRAEYAKPKRRNVGKLGSRNRPRINLNDVRPPRDEALIAELLEERNNLRKQFHEIS